MSGRYGGLQALIRNKAPYAMWTHCIIHEEALALKSMSNKLNLIMKRNIDAKNQNIPNSLYGHGSLTHSPAILLQCTMAFTWKRLIPYI